MTKKMKIKKLLLLRLAVSLGLGIMVGYALGYSQAVSLCVEIGMKMTNIEFKPEFIAEFPKLINYLNI